MDPFIATIAIFAFNFAPENWQYCNGGIYSIAQNNALFALVGTLYGGTGVSTFGVPDLRGRVPIGMGQGVGLSNYIIGQNGGSELVTLTPNQMPTHTHTMTHTLVAVPKASTQAGTDNVPGATKVPALLPTIGAGVNTFTVNGYGTTPDANLMPGDISGSITAATAGGNQPHSIIQPFLAINYCIAFNGTYPNRQ